MTTITVKLEDVFSGGRSWGKELGVQEKKVLLDFCCGVQKAINKVQPAIRGRRREGAFTASISQSEEGVLTDYMTIGGNFRGRGREGGLDIMQ